MNQINVAVYPFEESFIPVLRYKELFGHCSLLFENLPGQDRIKSARKPACYCTRQASARQFLQLENVFSWFYF